ncbi:sugar ABC transporter permease [uncultured Sphaerochaeta sp.]|uniref:carbohydrate ABC transporter permease n=1 Tax=uncultured Sphaerochaeta sp. TaxID=886478 RepID=UPI002A0A19E5|nr:sugar ABC transporter permease [uncultured Sphaerochaeta sp.]
MVKTNTQEKTRRNRMGRKNAIQAGLMLSPAVILLIICSIYPFFWMFKYILYDYNGFTANFTGMQNIIRMVHDTNFWESVGHTFEYATYKIIFIIPLALLVAVLLHSGIAGSSLFRLVYFLPTVISSSISGMIFSFIFATSNGILNQMISRQIPWLTSPDYVMIAVTVLAVWGGFGNYMLYFITGMNGISSDVYEAAKIDGATTSQTFFRITLPMLSPVLKVVLMLAITSAFKDYEAIMVLSGGGPGNRSMVMFLYIYNLIFGSAYNVTQPQIGYGALLSCASAIIVGGVTLLYLKLSKKLDDVM